VSARRTDWLPPPELRGELTPSEDRIARRVAELIQTNHNDIPQFAGTEAIAAMLSVTPEYVREHWRELGGFRLPSDGGQGRLRFDLAEVGRRLRPDSEPKQRGTAKPHNRPSGRGVSLLPVKREKQ
jgi:hypothetical protein